MDVNRIGPSLPDQCVTASQLVRNFGVWQERAVRRPVYILHRGRPRLAIASIELLEAMCAPRAAETEWHTEREALFDALQELVLLLDDDGRVVAANPAARTYLGATADALRGQPLATATPGPVTGYLADAARRVALSRLAERVELGSPADDTPRLAVTIVPLPAGVAIVGVDLGRDDALAEAQGAVLAMDTALATLEGIAKIRINARGYLAHPSVSFARLTGLGMDTLTTVRFVSLIDIRARVATAEAIERVMVERRAAAIESTLLVNGSRALAVQIGLSPLERRLAVEGVQAVVVANTATS